MLHELKKSAAIRLQLRDLRPSDDGADLVRVRLHRDWGRFDNNGLLRTADLQLEIDTPAVAILQQDAVLVDDFEARSLRPNLIVSNLEVRGDIFARIIGREVT